MNNRNINSSALAEQSLARHVLQQQQRGAKQYQDRRHPQRFAYADTLFVNMLQHQQQHQQEQIYVQPQQLHWTLVPYSQFTTTFPLSNI